MKDAILREEDGLGPLVNAVKRKDVIIVKVLLGAGARPDMEHRRCTTPLIQAVEQQSWKNADLLMGRKLSRDDVNRTLILAHTLNMAGPIFKLIWEDQERRKLLAANQQRSISRIVI